MLTHFQSSLAPARALSTAEHALPRVFWPDSARAVRQPLAWLDDHAELLRQALRSSGAVLLRGFDIGTPELFGALATRFGGPLGDDYEGPSPRQVVGQGVYSASEVPGALAIPEHAEMSYLPRMARHLFFWCRQPALVGGATTLVDGRAVLARLAPASRARLLAQPLFIRRRHAPPSGRRDPFELKPWSEMFGTADRDEALERARAFGFRARFEKDGALTLEHEQWAVRVHPETHEWVWLNHLLVFHGSAPAAILSSAARRERLLRAAALYPAAFAYRLVAGYLGRQVASDVLFADGSPISDELVAHVREAVDALAVPVSWNRGDFAIVDNHLVLHGRRPFSGPRSIAVAWTRRRA